MLTNLPTLPAAATADRARLRPELAWMDDVETLHRAAVFEPAKDRPVLFSAVAWADVPITLDRADFGAMLGSSFYDLPILTPGMFLERERSAGRLQT